MGSFLSLLLCLSLSLSVFAQTQSDKHADLEQDTEQRLQWIREQNHSVLNKIKASPNRKAVSEWIYKTFDKPEILREQELSSGEVLQLIDRGLGKPTEFVLKNGTQEKVLFSNFSLARNNSFNFTRFHVSPDGKHAVLSFAEKGDIDQFWLQIFDIENGKTLGNKFLSASRDVTWVSNTHFWANSKDRGQAVKYDLQGAEIQSTNGYYSQTSSKGWYGIYDSDGIMWSSEAETYFVLGWDFELLGMSSTTIYIKVEDEKGLKIQKAARHQSKQLSLEDFIPNDGTVIDSGKVFNDFILLAKHFGSKRVLELWSYQGQLLHKIEIPEFVMIREVKESSSLRELELVLDSALKKKISVTYDLATQKWSQDIASLMMSSPELNLETKIIEVISADGTKFPVRMTYKKGLQPDGQRPVWIESYGGFGISGFLDAYYNPLFLDFFSRGGIQVGPGLRGGNEYGEEWHKAAKKEKKIKTFEDLIATANYFVQAGWTKPQYIISSGGSNGGLTVAASALLSPKSFGVVIPENGVLDLLKKEILDASNNGWSSEYGDSRMAEERSYLEPISPVELAARNEGPLFLIVNGRYDSRVNPAHSYKAKASLNENTRIDGRLISLNNAGHWSSSVLYQDLIGWRTQTIMWTTVYDHLGIAF